MVGPLAQNVSLDTTSLGHPAYRMCAHVRMALQQRGQTVERMGKKDAARMGIVTLGITNKVGFVYLGHVTRRNFLPGVEAVRPQRTEHQTMSVAPANLGGHSTTISADGCVNVIVGGLVNRVRKHSN